MWFKGSINEAINKSKTEKKLFVVFVNGSDDISRKMDALFDSLSAKLSELSIVAIKLDSQSENCKLFSQIYPVILIPSTYFIDLNGVAVEIIGGSLEDQNVLFEKINKTVDIFKQSLDTISDPKSVSSSNTEIDNQMTTTASTSGIQPVPPNSSEPIPETISSSETVPIDEKVERANRLIEAIRLKKAKEEEENQRAQEIERRKGMKEMQNSKRMREDKEAMDIIKEREREKEEQKLAKQRVLAQIAADREERKRKQMGFSDNQNPEPSTSQQKTTEETEVRQRSHDKTRIQFRLPDGSAANHMFDANDSLESVRQFVSSNFNIRSFLLSTTFPRKEFSSEDYPKTLNELSLCPSSVLLVIVKTGTTMSGAVASNSIFLQIFSLISIPFVMIWSFITSFFNRSEQPTLRPNNQRQEQQRNQKTFYSKDGNIARMKKEEDDDDNNTWNGNSTQQM